jgi:hypothetical protein
MHPVPPFDGLKALLAEREGMRLYQEVAAPCAALERALTNKSN